MARRPTPGPGGRSSTIWDVTLTVAGRKSDVGTDARVAPALPSLAKSSRVDAPVSSWGPNVRSHHVPRGRQRAERVPADNRTQILASGSACCPEPPPAWDRGASWVRHGMSQALGTDPERQLPSLFSVPRLSPHWAAVSGAHCHTDPRFNEGTRSRLLDSGSSKAAAGKGRREAGQELGSGSSLWRVYTGDLHRVVRKRRREGAPRLGERGQANT